MNVEHNIANQKLELIKWLSTIEDISIIEKIMEVKKQENSHAMSIHEKKSIEQGIVDATAGKLNSHSQARKLYEKWL